MNTKVLIGLATAFTMSCHLSTQNKKEMELQKMGIVEITTFKLHQGVNENDFELSARSMQKDFLEKQKGFIKRTLTVSKDSLWTDIVIWEDQQSAEMAMKRAEASDLVLPFMEKINFNSVKMNFTTPVLIAE